MKLKTTDCPRALRPKRPWTISVFSTSPSFSNCNCPRALRAKRPWTISVFQLHACCIHRNKHHHPHTSLLAGFPYDVLRTLVHACCMCSVCCLECLPYEVLHTTAFGQQASLSESVAISGLQYIKLIIPRFVTCDEVCAR